MPKPIFLILAAGGASRLGRPKQLLKYKGETLIARTIRVVEESGAIPVVVLGAYEERVRLEIGRADSVVNTNWQAGMATSILAGLNFVDGEFPGAPVGIILTDQPAIGADHVSALVEAISKVDIACTHYPKGPGVPALFAPNALSLLREVEGDRGAREILRQELHLNRYTMKVFQNWDTLDVDEQGDWDNFLGSNE